MRLKLIAGNLIIVLLVGVGSYLVVRMQLHTELVRELDTLQVRTIDSFFVHLVRLFALDLPVADWAKEEGIAEAEIRERINEAVARKMAAKNANIGPQQMRALEKQFLLWVLDHQWKDHLLSMDHLKEGIGLRAYGQKNPLVEYKRESFDMFGQMQERIENDIVRAHPLPLSAVRLTGGPLKRAQDLDAKYLLQLEPDRMLAYYRERGQLRPFLVRATVVSGLLAALGILAAACGDDAETTRSTDGALPGMRDG